VKTLQLVDGDLVLSNQNFVMLDDRATLRQRIFNRLALYLGEFSLAPDAGMDWFTLRANKISPSPSLQRGEIEIAVRREILKDSEVTSINSLEVIVIDSVEKSRIYERPMRDCLINWNVNSIYGVVNNA